MSIQPQCAIENAVKRLLNAVRPVEGRETVPLTQSMGRVLAKTLPARVNVPPFDRSPLDGYAVKSADLLAASRENPVRLTVTQRIFAGQTPAAPIQRGQAARVMTGAPVPPGADCVVRQEDTDCGGEMVKIYALPSQRNVVKCGSDTAEGQILLERGIRLDWTHLALLASQGYGTVPVVSRPRIAVLTTGDELVEPGRPLSAGRIYNSNSALILGRLLSLGVDAVDGGIGADDPALLAEQIRAHLADCDMVITSGGVSVGQRDCMPLVLKELSGNLIFHGVAAKPGTPTMAFEVGKPVLCLSGNPFAAGVMLELLGRPAIERLCGSGWKPVRTEAVLRGSFSKTSCMRRFVRGRLTGGVVEIAAHGHESGSVAALAGCNCLLDLPAGSGPVYDGIRVCVLSME